MMVQKISTFTTADGKVFNNLADATRHEARATTIPRLQEAFPKVDAGAVLDWFHANFRLMGKDVKPRAKRTPKTDGTKQAPEGGPAGEQKAA